MTDFEGVRISLDSGALGELLGFARRRGENLRPALLSCGEYLLRETKERIKAETGPEGEAWPPLSDATIDRKGHDHALQDSGRLQASITYRAGRMSLEVGSNVEYAAIHQFGGPVKVEARTGSVRLRTDGAGGLLRQGSAARRKSGPMSKFTASGAVFAREGDAQSVERSFRVEAHEYEMPARPYLGVNAGDRAELVAILREWILARLAR